MATINEFFTDIAFHPGDTLEEKLQEMQIGPKEFAIRTGKPEKTITAIIKGDSAVTPEMAMLFENVLQIPARFWIKKQANFDEYKARQKREVALQEAVEWARKFPYAEMVKKGWLPAKIKIEDRVAALFLFFGLSSEDAWNDYFINQQLKVAFRISLAHTKEPYAISAWIRQGEIQSREIRCGEYSESNFKKSLPEIKSLMATQPSDFFGQLQEICLRSGVKVVYTPCIQKAPLNGATRWINNNPVIQLTARYNQNDRFWFTFFHEVGHIFLHGKKEVFLEEISYSDADRIKEEQADNFAIEWTFSEEEEAEILQSFLLSVDQIRKYATKFNTHPAMIIGRLQKKNILPYSVGRECFVKLDFVDLE